MKLKGNVLILSTLFFSMLLFFYSCKKDSNPSGEVIPANQTKLAVYLMDGPTDYQKVLVDIKRIEIKIDTCRKHSDDDRDGKGCNDDKDSINSRCEIWDTLAIRPGIYDLLKLRNGVDTLLASGFVLRGKVLRLKLTLGDNNSVMADSIVSPLNLVNGQHFIYSNLGKDHLDSISSNNFKLYLDFDLSRSIKYISGKYWLKPVLKPFGKHSTGEIEGKIRPVNSFGTIKAYNSTDTAFARPEKEGEFKIRGLKDGTYSLFIDGINGYKDSTINNIKVTRGNDTKLGTILLHQ